MGFIVYVELAECLQRWHLSFFIFFSFCYFKEIIHINEKYEGFLSKILKDKFFLKRLKRSIKVK